MQEFVGKVIVFKKAIEDLEVYAEAKMRARITKIFSEHDYCVIEVDYTEFDEQNKAFESRDYFDRFGTPTLTARDAGFYTPQEQIYVEHPSKVPFETYFDLVDTGVDGLLAMFKESGETDYVAWLEKKVLEHV